LQFSQIRLTLARTFMATLHPRRQIAKNRKVKVYAPTPALARGKRQASLKEPVPELREQTPDPHQK